MNAGTLALLILLGLCLVASPDDTPRPGPAPGAVSIELGQADGGTAAFVLLGLDRARLDRLGRAGLTADQWLAVFRVSVASDAKGDADEPEAMLGTHSVANGAVRFVPRFPPEPGLTYRARFDPGQLPDRDGTPPGPPVVTTLTVPKRPASPAAVVVKVDPAGDRLPENLLKFYVHFSRPMASGDVYRHFWLLGPDGRPVDTPFLELEQELWDVAGRRLTLILDPGRVKSGLAPREQAGPVLVAGQSYTLAIDPTLTDAEGEPLAAPYRKPFRVVAADTVPPDPARWALSAPAAGTEDPLTLRFGEPLDRGTLGRALTLRDNLGRAVKGREVIADSAEEWRFLPAAPWPVGAYRIDVDPALEDLAGNTIGRPFEIDLFDKVGPEAAPGAEAAAVRFRVMETRKP